MPSATALLVTIPAALVSLAHAQNSTTSAYSYTVPAGSVSPTQAAYYCTSQRNTCRQVCGGSAPTDRCDETTFNYECVCGDGTTPDMTRFNGSLPYFQCQEYQNKCVQDTDDASEQAKCLEIQCGGQDPIAAESSIQASMASAMNTASSTSDSSSEPTGGDSSSSSDNAEQTEDSPNSNGAASARAMTDMNSSYGLMAFIATALMLFGGVLAL